MGIDFYLPMKLLLLVLALIALSSAKCWKDATTDTEKESKLESNPCTAAWYKDAFCPSNSGSVLDTPSTPWASRYCPKTAAEIVDNNKPACGEEVPTCREPVNLLQNGIKFTPKAVEYSSNDTRAGSNFRVCKSFADKVYDECSKGKFFDTVERDCRSWDKQYDDAEQFTLAYINTLAQAEGYAGAEYFDGSGDECFNAGSLLGLSIALFASLL